jgi:hypothetical protein
MSSRSIFNGAELMAERLVATIATTYRTKHFQRVWECKNKSLKKKEKGGRFGQGCRIHFLSHQLFSSFTAFH